MLRVLPAQLPWMAWFPRTLHSIQPEASVNATCSNLYFTARLSQDVRTCLAANKVARFISWVVKRATSLFNSFCSNVSKQVASFLLPPYLHYTFHKHVAGTRLRSRGKRQKTVSNRKNNINRSEPSGILGRGKGHPFPSPDYLSTRFTGWFFFSPTPIFPPFSHNVEPGPRLIYTRILKFKSQLTFAVFAAVSHLSEPLRKQTFTSTGSKGYGLLLLLWLMDFDMFCVFLCYKVRCLWSYCDWRQRKTKMWRRLFELQSSRVFEKCSKKLSLISLRLCYFYVLLVFSFWSLHGSLCGSWL